MGNRYIVTVCCPSCGLVDSDVGYAPTCGLTEWECPQCGTIIQLGEYTGISEEQASNKGVIDALMGALQRRSE